MTSVGIIGAGRAATLHAEAVRATAGMKLTGLAARSTASPRATALAGGLDCPVLTLADLARACDLAVVATPPAARLEALAELASSRRVRAVLVESPVATTLDNIDRLGSALAGRPVMVGANLLHAPAVRRVLNAVASMDSHHLELRLAVPDPARGPGAGPKFGGGVMLDPAAGFWPLLLAALGAAVESVAAPRLEVSDGLDHAAVVILRAAAGRRARADLRWAAPVAEASLEAADAAHVARVDMWPAPVAEIDGAPAAVPADAANPLSALGFIAQLDRLDRVGRGEAASWPDLAVGSAALTVAVAAALSARRGGEPVGVEEVPRDASPFGVLGGLV